MRLALVVLSLFTLSCMQYDFAPVTPKLIGLRTKELDVSATKLRPNIVVLLDRSGSMALPIDASDPACPAGCGSGAACPAACPTRISEVRRAMSAFLNGPEGTFARWGLAAFPEDAAVNQCSATASWLIDLPAPAPDDLDAALNAQWDQGARDVATAIEAISPLGGTPTAGSLEFVGRNPVYADVGRGDFVLLLTDGLPNCNPANPNGVCTDTSAARLAACACTVGSCASATTCSIGCLDQEAMRAAANLTTRGITTMVVGFGADTAGGPARAVLNGLALAGGLARTCKADLDCGAGDACGAGGVCGRAYFQASTAAELSAVLKRLKGVIEDPDSYCTISLPTAPVNPAFIRVLVEGAHADPLTGAWAYDPATQAIKFRGALCDRILASTPVAPLKLNIQYIDQLE